MTKSLFKTLSSSSALILLLPGVSIADVTALEVWDNWKSYGESFGQTISVGSEQTNGDTLILGDVTISMTFPEGQFAGNLDFIELQERADGTVAITMAPEYPMSLSVDPAEGESLDIEILVTQTGMALIASGGDGTISYDYLASDLGLVVDKFIVDGKDLGADISVNMTDLDGQYAMTEGDPRNITSAMLIGSTNFNFDVVDPDEGVQIDMSGTMQNLSSRSSAKIPKVIDIEDPAWAFSSDFGMEGGLSTGVVEYAMVVTDENGPFKFEGSSDSTSFDFGLDEGTVVYGGTTTETEYRISGAQIPFPEVSLALAESAFEFKMPMKKTTVPNDFSFLTKLIGLKVSDDIWGMLDPGQILPRDAANLIVDVSGKMNWMINVADPAEMAAAEDSPDMPVEMHELNINDFTVAIAGAEVNGTGGFTFDNSDLVTFDGMPAPTGEINLNILSVNLLMDRLIQMGILPQEQAMGARMMLGLFARPADGEDKMTSKIEVKGDGSVLANGQRIK